MDLFLNAVIFGVVLGLVSGAIDWILTRKIRRDIEELQAAMLGFNFQLMRLEEIEAKSVKVTRTNAAKEAK